jgi:hypothetical protein
VKYKVTFNPIRTEEELTEHYRKHLLNHLVTVFQWEGLEEDVPAEYLEMTLLLNGCCGFVKWEDKYIPMLCNPADKPDPYFRATSYIYANPVVGSGNISPNAVIFNDMLGAWFPRDCNEVIDKYAHLLAAAEISLKIALKNARLTHIAVTDNEDDVANINKMFADVANGALATTVSTKTLIGDGLKILPTVSNATDYLRQITEAREYLYNLFLSEFGIHANTVLKRERQLTGEIDMQIEKPMFNIESMLQARQKGAEKVNKELGLNLKVSINPKFMYVEDESEVNEDVSTPDTETGDEDIGDQSDETSADNGVSDSGSGSDSGDAESKS